ncbi:MAG: hypothetical protein GX605_12920, partial [Chloroflexi bacterium]|nr:hypothetical protein [Chloroflexota bacterium]
MRTASGHLSQQRQCGCAECANGPGKARCTRSDGNCTVHASLALRTYVRRLIDTFGDSGLVVDGAVDGLPAESRPE